MDDISLHLHNLPKLDGLVSCFINSQTGLFRPSSTVSVGASADSYYEYLIKQWLQTGKSKDWYVPPTYLYTVHIQAMKSQCSDVSILLVDALCI